MFGPTLLLLTDVGTEVPHYRPRLRFAGNRDSQWKSHAVDHPRLIGSKVGLARNPVYPPCTSVRRFCCFSPYWRFLKSVTYAVSITLRGSNPTNLTQTEGTSTVKRYSFKSAVNREYVGL